eukprot:m.202586 g.202586  ORF g.202586 m.202586 type:complete len:751 (-) comp25984_c2_seq2:659-2911(-)
MTDNNNNDNKGGGGGGGQTQSKGVGLGGRPSLSRSISQPDQSLQTHFPLAVGPTEVVCHDLFCALRASDAQSHQGRVFITGEGLYFISLNFTVKLCIKFCDIISIKQVHLNKLLPPSIVIAVEPAPAFHEFTFPHSERALNILQSITEGKARPMLDRTISHQPRTLSRGPELHRSLSSGNENETPTLEPPSQPLPPQSYKPSRRKHQPPPTIPNHLVSQEADALVPVPVPTARQRRRPSPQKRPLVFGTKDDNNSNIIPDDSSVEPVPPISSLDPDPNPTPTPPFWGSQTAGNDATKPCKYFMSGFCRDGQNCRFSHGDATKNNEEFRKYIRSMSKSSDFQDDDDDDDDSPFGRSPYHRLGRYSKKEIKGLVKCYSCAFAARPELEAGGLIVLHETMLAAALELDADMPWPLTFEMTHPESGTCLHAGVLDFTAPDDGIAYLPSWIMESLGVEDSDEIKIKAVKLPKGTFCKLQPLSMAWADVSMDQQQAVMEFQLRKYSTLTEGQVVSIDFEASSLQFKIVECKPGPGISIIDTDIAIDFAKPLETEADTRPVLTIGQERQGKATKDEYRFFTLRPQLGQALPTTMEITVVSHKGDPDLYVSQTTPKPSQSNYFRCAQDVGNVSLVIGETSKGWLPKSHTSNSVHIGVCCLTSDCEFTIATRQVPDNTPCSLDQSDHALTRFNESNDNESNSNSSSSLRRPLTNSLKKRMNLPLTAKVRRTTKRTTYRFRHLVIEEIRLAVIKVCSWTC